MTVTCAIIFFNNKILVTQRSATMKLPLKWEFPGGKLEKNESELECIKREIKEEINIEIEILSRLTQVFHDYGTFQITLIPFVAKYISGELNLSQHSDYKLLKIDELLHLNWAEADVPIVHEVIRSIENLRDDGPNI